MAIATAVIPLKLITSRRLQPKNHTSFLAQNRPFKVSCCVLHNPSSLHTHCQKLVNEFDPRIPIEKTLTPPRSWYTDPSFYDYELHRIFYGGWQAVGYTEQIKDPRGFFTVRFGNIEFLVC
ncbi:choline monooxygenase, chloroplastic-like [Hevea brasiliensis]|uniref:choline monooxygenase, chloroplastic-like n=1 Tax=Hevea brasiliensis TaxID=3981 RepID=UPI0025F4A46D|nr:choline monooxygenase, chloroplastic-like [Hevea brasiliensis]